MAGIMFRGLLQGTVGGGGSVVGGATPWDDEFNVGTVLDTTGARFTGAVPWTLINVNANFVNTIVSGDQLTITTSSNGLNMEVKGGTMPLSGAGTDWAFRASCAGITPTGNYYVSHGLYLSESGSGKAVALAVGDDFGTKVEVRLMPAGWTANAASTALTSYVVDIEIAKVGANLVYKYYDTGTAAWVTLATRAITTDFTTAPTHIGVYGNNSVANVGNTAHKFNWFRKVA